LPLSAAMFGTATTARSLSSPPPRERPRDRRAVGSVGVEIDHERVALHVHDAGEDEADILARQRTGEALGDGAVLVVDRVGAEVGVVAALCAAVVPGAARPVRYVDRAVAPHEL